MGSVVSLIGRKNKIKKRMRKKLELLGLRGDATFEQLVVWCEEKYVRKLDTDQGTRGKKLTF